MTRFLRRNWTIRGDVVTSVYKMVLCYFIASKKTKNYHLLWFLVTIECNLVNPSLLVIFVFFIVFFLGFLSISTLGFEKKTLIVFVLIAFMLIVPIDLYFTVSKTLKQPEKISEYYNVQIKNKEKHIEINFKEKNNIKVDYELVIATEVNFKIENNEGKLTISTTKDNKKKEITKEELRDYFSKIKNVKIVNENSDNNKITIEDFK